MNRSLRHKGWFGFVLLLAGLLPAAPVFAAAVFDPALQPTGYVVPPVLSNYDVSGGNETSYQGTFDKEYWYGNVHAFPISATGVLNYATDRWPGGARAFINAQNYDSDRRIITMNDATPQVIVPFRSGGGSTGISAAQLALIGSQAKLDYVRGDRTNETTAGGMRVRRAVLGDIMHSRPYMYDGLLYIGANDGMVHVINVSNADALALGVVAGSELYAYIPSMLIPKLGNLSVTPYVHTYFVDGPLAFDIATFTDALGVKTQRKVLVGTLGAGGKGLYALDVTTPVPASASESAVVSLNNVKWEKKAGDPGYANLGYTYSTPQIVRVRKQVAGVDTDVPAVIIGNGYVNSGNYQSSLLVIDLADGSVIREILAGSGTAASPNGMSSPTVVDSNSDNIADYVFAGDIDGNLWKFNLTAVAPASWTGSLVYAATGKAITIAPSVIKHPNGGFLVNFATGRMLTTGTGGDDTSTTPVNSAYGIWDSAPGTAIVTQTLTPGTYLRADASTIKVRTATVNAVNWSTDKGWRTDLPAGERVVGDGSFIASGRYYFMANNPTIVNASPLPPKGESWLIELDYKTGGGSTIPFLDLSGDLALSDVDRLPNGTGGRIMTEAGVPCAKYADTGVSSQPVLTNLIQLNTALYNNHPDMVVPLPSPDRGVSGGHFDFDINYPGPGSVADGSYTCVGNVTSCKNVPAGNYTLPSGYFETCTHASAAGSPYSCDGKFASSDCPGVTLPAGTVKDSCTQGSSSWTASCVGGPYSSCIGHSPTPSYTSLKTGATESCSATATDGATHTCVGDYSASTCSGHPTTYTMPPGAVDVCARTADGALAGTYVCNGRYPGDFPGPSGGCIGHAPTPAYTSIPTTSHQVCTELKTSGVWKTTCKVYPMNTSCTIKTYTNNCTITEWLTNCTTLDWTTSCTRFKPVDFFAWGNATTSVSNPHQVNVHIHEYDDIFDRTGVDMLNPCDSSMDLKNVIDKGKTTAAATTQFKVLLVNQAYSPAATIKLGGSTFEKVTDYDNHFDNISLLPTYTRATLNNNFMVNLPKTAFLPQDWVGSSGDIRSGLMPLKYACVWRDVFTDCSGTNRSCNGPADEWRNGGLTIQVIKASTPASAIEINGPSDGHLGKLGHRIKRDQRDNYLLLEYAIWWHHPNDLCMHTSGWTKTPPQDDVSDATPQTGVAGCTDPKGNFGTGGSTILSIVTTIVGDVMTTVTTYVGYGTVTVVRTRNPNNTYTIRTTDNVTGVSSEVTTVNLEGSVDRSGEESGSAGVGRFSWRELGN